MSFLRIGIRFKMSSLVYICIVESIAQPSKSRISDLEYIHHQLREKACH